MRRIKKFFQRLNRATTEVGTEHFDDDKDWDQRGKLPAWQTARVRERYEQKKAQQAAKKQSKKSESSETKTD